MKALQLPCNPRAVHQQCTYGCLLKPYTAILISQETARLDCIQASPAALWEGQLCHGSKHVLLVMIMAASDYWCLNLHINSMYRTAVFDIIIESNKPYASCDSRHGTQTSSVITWGLNAAFVVPARWHAASLCAYTAVGLNHIHLHAD